MDVEKLKRKTNDQVCTQTEREVKEQASFNLRACKLGVQHSNYRHETIWVEGVKNDSITLKSQDGLWNYGWGLRLNLIQTSNLYVTETMFDNKPEYF